MMSLSLLQVIILLPLLALVTAWLYIQWAYHRQLTLARKLPTAIPAYPWIGHITVLTTKFRVGSQAWKLGSGHRSGISCMWMGPVPWIMINKAEHIKVILNNSNSLGKAKLYDRFKWILGDGLLTAPVNLWKKSRKHINPMFHSENLQRLLPIINETARHLVEDLSEHVDKEVFDCEDYLFFIYSINMFKLLLGPDVEMNRKSKLLKDVVETIQIFAKELGEQSYNPFLRSDTIRKVLKKQAFKHLDALCTNLKVSTEKTQELKARVESNMQMDCVKTFQDVFNLLKEKDPIFNETYKQAEIITLIGTGTDTISISVSCCLLALGSHPDIQKNLYEEIISVVGDSSEIDAEDISKMTYLDQVLKETLRCFIIVPFAARRCNGDIQLDGYTIPSDTTVIVSFLGLHMDEEVYPDPLTFDPDRFSPENVAKRHSYSFQPFSGGPRNCIGKNYAMMAMKITLVHLLKNYEIKSCVEIKNMTRKFNLTMSLVDGYKISIKKRF